MTDPAIRTHEARMRQLGIGQTEMPAALPPPAPPATADPPDDDATPHTPRS